MIGGRGKAAKAAREARAKALWQAMTVRYRSDGHIRFDLPDALRTPGAALVLEEGLGRIEGVYRVHVFPGAGKLSIRYMEDVCGIAPIAKALAALVTEAVDMDAAVPPPSVPMVMEGEVVPPGWLDRIKDSAPVRAVRSRYDDLRAKIDVVSKIVAIKTGKPVPGGVDVQEWIIHFLNDLVAFYLIRSHWDRIIGQWLPRPWAFRYQWMTVVYLTFLLVRYRKGAVPKLVKK
ncbi:hypothetical protein H261_05057 [Paramagnetospirillum caucaseum]|uniref:Uncharacterized protein n=1 Tax=Paramagnetospirillum caucaseum TaxID=1244869 RepID=M3AE79_9PROT|nr:hypothetical protein [Paramagnetospirillum caucaseum]EME71103.1 hypothetical protein H261_05057 [Paramagnetospirillum caucaseum]